MPGPKQETRLSEHLRRQVESGVRRARIYAFRDGKGTLLENVAIAASGSTEVRHGLGYAPRGVLLASIPRYAATGVSPSTPYEVCDANGVATGRTKEKLDIYNQAGTACFVDLWVY